MFERSEPQAIALRGTIESAAIGGDAAAAAQQLTVLGVLFDGRIRQLCFDHTGALLVLSGRGVRRVDPETLLELGRWLPSRHVQSVHACGERLWVVIDDALFLAPFGGELGAPRAAVPHQMNHRYTAMGSRLALVRERGALVIDGEGGEVREFHFDAAWFASLRSERGPEWALLSPSGRHVAVTRQHGGYTVVWEVESGRQVMARAHSEATVLLDDARTLKVERESASLFNFTDESWSRLPANAHFEDAWVVGDRLLAADPNGGFALFERDTMALLAELDALPSGYGRVSGTVCAALSATHVATYAGMAGALRVTAIGGATVESPGWRGGGESLSLGRSGRRLGVFREWGNGVLECIDIEAGALVEVRGEHEDITTSAITGDGEQMVVPCGSILRARTVHVGAFAAAPSEAVHTIKSCVHELVNYGDDAYAISTYTLRGSGYVGLHRAGVARALAKVTLGKEAPWRIAVGHGGGELLVAWESATILYDLSKRPKAIATWNQRAGAVALGPRGHAAVLHGGNQLIVRTPGSGEITVTTPPRQGHSGARLAFSRDGGLIFVGATDGILEVRRAGDGELLRELTLHVGGFVALEASGEALWTMGDDGIIHILGVAVGAAAV